MGSNPYDGQPTGSLPGQDIYLPHRLSFLHLCTKTINLIRSGSNVCPTHEGVPGSLTIFTSFQLLSLNGSLKRITRPRRRCLSMGQLEKVIKVRQYDHIFRLVVEG